MACIINWFPFVTLNFISYESVVGKQWNPFFVFSFLCSNYKQFDFPHNSRVVILIAQCKEWEHYKPGWTPLFAKVALKLALWNSKHVHKRCEYKFNIQEVVFVAKVAK